MTLTMTCTGCRLNAESAGLNRFEDIPGENAAAGQFHQPSGLIAGLSMRRLHDPHCVSPSQVDVEIRKLIDLHLDIGRLPCPVIQPQQAHLLVVGQAVDHADKDIYPEHRLFIDGQDEILFFKSGLA